MHFENGIVICNKTIKNQILKEPKLLNIKLVNMQEFMKEFYFDYDEKAILFLMKKYNYKYEVAQMYLENIYYIDESESDKINKLKTVKNEVNHLLIYNEKFKDYIKNKKIYIVNHKLNKFEQNTFKELNYELIETRISKYNHKVNVFNTINEEVEYVAIKICELINKSIDINKIKLSNVTEEYINPIKRIFKMYNLKVNLTEKNPIISTKIGNKFLNTNIEDFISNNEGKIVNKIVNICNKYAWSNYNIDLIKHDLETTNIESPKYLNAIEIIDYKEVNSDDYIFLMGFNEGVIPRIYKDEDYLNDSIKPIFLETTIEKNKLEKEETLLAIKSIKNLTITCKLKDSKKSYYPSNLITELDNNKKENNITYSSVNDTVKLASYLDDYIKYGTINDSLSILQSTYKIPYKKYNHEYKKINNLKLDDLSLSYSSFEQYNECNFKYYVSKILKLDIFEDNFQATIGSLVHYVLEETLKEGKKVEDCIQEYMQDKTKTNKEKFFVEKLTKDLNFIVETIQEQQKTCHLDQALYEEKISIKKDNYTVTGIIDKVLYKKYENDIILALIDYKTGYASIDLSYIDYGLNMQLPIYIYLINHSKLKNIKIAGFYLQKIKLELPKKSKLTPIETQKESLKLEGYSNENQKILEELDITYNSSQVIKGLKTKNDGSFYYYSKVMNSSKMDELNKFAEKKLDETAHNILDANFTINPKKDKENIGCRYCKFKNICYMEEYDTVKIEKAGDEIDTEEAGYSNMD